MKVLFIRNLILTNGLRDFNFKRMSVYTLPDPYALELISQGYCCKFGFLSELEEVSP